MITTDVHVRMEKDVKEGMDEFVKGIGITLSDYINMACKRAVFEQRIPFSTSMKQSELPDNMSIETAEQLDDFLERRFKEDDGTRRSSLEVLEKLGVEDKARKEQVYA